MKKILFDFTLNVQNVAFERKNLDISNLDLDNLKGIANGKMYIFFEPQRKYIKLETGIIDYLLQLKNVIEEIQTGNYTPFSVSCDWYSNSLKYDFENNSGILIIKETNENLFEIKTKFKIFQKSFIKFYEKVLLDLEIYYPELLHNDVYSNLKNQLK
ncbi:MAG TPA: hypothetical protein DEO36_00805 [Flavobacteriaceae bacterium]|nr:hypothetical protein [Flavobacteriaceae bacterium]